MPMSGASGYVRTGNGFIPTGIHRRPKDRSHAPMRYWGQRFFLRGSTADHKFGIGGPLPGIIQNNWLIPLIMVILLTGK